MTDEMTTRGSICLVDGEEYIRVQGLGQKNPCSGCAAHPDTHEPGLCTQLGHCGYDIWVLSDTQDDSEGVGDTITSAGAWVIPSPQPGRLRLTTAILRGRVLRIRLTHGSASTMACLLRRTSPRMEGTRMLVTKKAVAAEFRPIEVVIVIENQGELQAMREFCGLNITAARVCSTSTHQHIIESFLGDVWRAIKA